MLYRLFTVLFLLAGYALSAQQAPEGGSAIDYTAIGAPMPHFTIISQEPVQQVIGNNIVTKVMTDKMFKNDANLFVMTFSPICDHCENQTMMLEKNLELFKKSKIALICGKTYRQYLNNFLLITHKKDYPKINVGVDSLDFIKKILLYDQMPQLNIYDHNRKLIKAFSGAVPIDSFRQYIE